MIVCSCNVLTKRMIDRFIDHAGDIRRARDVYQGMGCRQRCGLCAETIRNIIATHEQTEPSSGCNATPFRRNRFNSPSERPFDGQAEGGGGTAS